MGEIGIPHRTFLCELNYWQTRRIIRGYRKRNRLLYQMMAENIFATIHIMRKPTKTVKDMFPGIFDDDDDEPTPQHSEEDIAKLQAEMAAYQKQGLKI